MAKPRGRSHVVFPLKGDTTVAFKIIALMPGLTVTDKRAIAALLDHFNRKTGQCDPSIETIARLLKVDRSTVIRAFRRATEVGLLQKHRHGGGFNRNSYQPIWARFRELDAEWHARRDERRRCREQAEMPLSRWQSGHPLGGNHATQTCQSNLSRKPLSAVRPSSSQAHDQATSSSLAMRAAAERRWVTALDRHFRRSPDDYAAIIEAVDTNLKEAATDAESHHRGSGFDYLMNALGALASAPPREGGSNP